MVVSLSVDLGELRRFRKDFSAMADSSPKLAEKVRRKLASRMKKLAKDNVMPRWPGSSGRLKQSIVFRKSGVNSTIVFAEAPYAGFVELGTDPHEIPNNPHWGLAGRVHPGAKPMRFMEGAYNELLREADGLIGEEVSKFFSKYNL